MDLSVFRKDNNFRELGGYPLADGRVVKHGMFYRSGSLANMDAEELQAVEKLGIKAIFDFRSQQEVDQKPDPEIPGARYYHVSALTDEAGNEIDLSPKGMENSDERFYSMQAQAMFLENFYGRLPFSPAYHVMFDEIRSGKTPILLHCSAGKDRTGIGAALILLVLGADEKTVMDDYLLTNVYREEAIQLFLDEHQYLIDAYPEAAYILKGFQGVNPEACTYALEHIKDRYADYPTYFLKKYGIDAEDRAYLIEKYTENQH